MSETTQKEAQDNNASAELTVQDLSALRQIIDVATQRGAFKANELAVVGNTYNKLEQFLNAVQAAQAQSAPEQQTGQSDQGE